MILWMLALVIIALVVVAALKKRLPGEGKVFQLVLVAITVVLVGIQWFGGREEGAWRDSTFTGAAGYKLGESIVETLPDGGRLLFLAQPGLLSNPQTVIQQVEGMRRAWKGTPFTIVGVQGIDDGQGHAADALPRWEEQALPEEAEIEDEVVDDTMTGEIMAYEVTRGLLLRELNKHPDIDGIVICFLVPKLGDARRLPENLPPLFLLQVPPNEYTDYLIQRGLVKAAVYYKQRPDWNRKPQRGDSVDEVFGIRYELVTGES